MLNCGAFGGSRLPPRFVSASLYDMQAEKAQAMPPDSTSVSTADARSGPRLPGMFSRYKDRIEEELGRAVPDTDGADVHLLLRYHLGWVDRRGGMAISASSQGKALRPTLCMFACEALKPDCASAMPAAG